MRRKLNGLKKTKVMKDTTSVKVFAGTSVWPCTYFTPKPVNGRRRRMVREWIWIHTGKITQGSTAWIIPAGSRFFWITPSQAGVSRQDGRAANVFILFPEPIKEFIGMLAVYGDLYFE
jgi:hypothetical protein